jgi:hypothetical protein
MLYLTSSTHSVISAAESRISINCGFPNEEGTLRWAIPEQSVDGLIWFIPEPNGYGECTKEQMMEGVDLEGIILLERNPAWFSTGDGGL